MSAEILGVEQKIRLLLTGASLYDLDSVKRFLYRSRALLNTDVCIGLH